MALQQKTLSNRTVAALRVTRDTVFWDRDLTGFGVRVYPTGGKVYVAQARGPEGPDKPDKPKRVTLGRHGVISAEQARRRAALIIMRIKAGEEPVPLPLAVKAVGGPTVADLAARYLEEHVAVRVKPRTAVKARIAVRRQILPALGQVPLVAVERAQVVELQQKMSGTPSAANTAVKTLSHMYRLAAGWGMVPEGCNPCRSVATFPERKRERFLTDAEFVRLGRVLDEAVARGSATPTSVAVILLLSVTGCRKNEILTLRWEDVDLDARIGKLLGHSKVQTTARYAHLANDPIKAAANRIASRIAEVAG